MISDSIFTMPWYSSAAVPKINPWNHAIVFISCPSMSIPELSSLECLKNILSDIRLDSMPISFNDDYPNEPNVSYKIIIFSSLFFINILTIRTNLNGMINNELQTGSLCAILTSLRAPTRLFVCLFVCIQHSYRRTELRKEWRTTLHGKNTK